MPALTKAARGEAEATARQRRGGDGVGTARPGWPAATASGRRGVETALGRRGVATTSGLEGAAGDGVGSGARATATAAGQPGGVVGGQMRDETENFHKCCLYTLSISPGWSHQPGPKAPFSPGWCHQPGPKALCCPAPNV